MKQPGLGHAGTGAQSYAGYMSGSRAREARRSARPADAPPESIDRSAVWIDGVPYLPDEEADEIMEAEAARWSELMQRLAE